MTPTYTVVLLLVAVMLDLRAKPASPINFTVKEPAPTSAGNIHQSSVRLDEDSHPSTCRIMWDQRREERLCVHMPLRTSSEPEPCDTVLP